MSAIPLDALFQHVERLFRTGNLPASSSDFGYSKQKPINKAPLVNIQGYEIWQKPEK